MQTTESQILNDSEPYSAVLLFGPPGAGKGTVGRVLATAGNHIHLSSGDIFRGLAPDSGAGKLFQSYAGRGFLVPDEVTIQIWHHYVNGLIATNRYFPKKQLLLLDGIPRTPTQVELTRPYLNILAVLVFEMPNIEGLIKRLQKRAIIEKRMDDADEGVLRKRMEVYEKETLQLLKCFPEKVIHKCNADQRPMEVLRDVLSSMANILSYS